MNARCWSRLETSRSSATACQSFPRRGGSSNSRLITNVLMTPWNREFCILSDRYAVAALNLKMLNRCVRAIDEEDMPWPR